MAAMAEEEGKQTPMEEEKPHYRGWKSMPYVIGNETFEKLGTIGTSSNLIVYLTTVFHMQSVTAATLINIWSGTTNIATLVGAFLSDAYLGRYKTLGFACLASFTGMVLLTLTSAIPSLHPPKCDPGAACAGPTSWQYTFLLGGLGFLVIGAGGIRPCNLAFGADQFDPNTESGKRGINSFFNWYYFTFTIAMMVSSTAIIYIQSSISWTVGLAIPASLMFLSCAFFFLGSPIYVKVRPEGSPFTSFVRVFVAAVRKRKLKLPAMGSASEPAFFDPPMRSLVISKLPQTDQFRVLDKAAIVINPKDELQHNPDTGAPTPADPWRLCTLQEVEVVKCLLRVLPVWSAAIIYYTVHVQQTTYVVFQALQSDRHLVRGHSFLIPAGSFIVFSMLAVTLWIPFYDRVLVPFLRRRVTGIESGITLLQRIGVGISLSIVVMVVSALVEQHRRSVALSGHVIGVSPRGGAVSAMSSLWLVPQLTLNGLSEAFCMIGQVEFYYKQFPENMRSVAGSLTFCGVALSHYLSGLMIAVVARVTGGGEGKGESWLAEDLNKGRLDYYYYLIAVMGVVNFAYFLVCARWYRYKGEAPEEVAAAGGSEVAMGELKSSSMNGKDGPEP